MSKPVLSSMCRRCQSRFFARQQRSHLSTSTSRNAVRDNTRQSNTARNAPPPPPMAPSDELRQLARNASNEALTRPQAGVAPDEPYHLNVYTHKHNTHITFTEPSRDPILSYSAGNIGLRKGQRGSFDAAYQLASYMFRKMAEKNWKAGGKKSNQVPVTLNDPKTRERGIEVVLRGYGPGREAFQKAILGAEGRVIKGLIKRVTDGTRLKFGGTRSPAVRRLG
ncbi:hypothetical protein H2198_002606 [Neophaeococcomyces mojaviensis]|uniref:Uncharacterized protein n=1 Tax=Neophaeococcomyces mojaviensis TaxID=3383035 RepID=A0ACC3ADL3_9EURO|nr:hypothetical protein H2198_002606 [Knufia sp. JES_112]